MTRRPGAAGPEDGDDAGAASGSAGSSGGGVGDGAPSGAGEPGAAEPPGGRSARPAFLGGAFRPSITDTDGAPPPGGQRAVGEMPAGGPGARRGRWADAPRTPRSPGGWDTQSRALVSGAPQPEAGGAPCEGLGSGGPASSAGPQAAAASGSVPAAGPIPSPSPSCGSGSGQRPRRVDDARHAEGRGDGIPGGGEVAGGGGGSGRLPSSAAPEAAAASGDGARPVGSRGKGTPCGGEVAGRGGGGGRSPLAGAQEGPDAAGAGPVGRGSADPVRGLMRRHRELCAGAVDPLEIAAGLEAHGVTDRTAARFRHRDVFSLAEELYARVPRDDEGPGAPAAPPPRGRVGGRLAVGALHLVPGALGVATVVEIGRAHV